MNAVRDFSEVHFITGHTHHNSTMVINDKVIEHNTAAVCETWWWSTFFSDRAICVDGSPAGYGIYTVNSTDVKWSYKGIGEPAGYQFRTYDMNTVKKHLDNSTYKALLRAVTTRATTMEKWAITLFISMSGTTIRPGRSRCGRMARRLR